MAWEDFLAEAASYSDATWLDVPADIRRMLKKNLELDKNLATSCFAFGDTHNLKDDMWRLYRWGKEGAGDLDTLKMVGCERLSSEAKVFVDYYGFTDAAALLEHASKALAEAPDHEALSKVAYAIEHCLVGLHYWVDISIPWAELSPVHAKIIKGRDAS